jgi:cyclic pyranopterin phosphate synthase
MSMFYGESKNRSIEVLGSESAQASELSLRMMEAERLCPTDIQVDASLRIKVLDTCGYTCTFCHNEGTPVTIDNIQNTSGTYSDTGRSGRVSIFTKDNGVNFLAAKVMPDDQLRSAIVHLQDKVTLNEIHLTGGEPTLDAQLPDLVAFLRSLGLTVKITSNGERFSSMAQKLKDAGLSKIVFSVFGTTPEELAAIQGSRYANVEFASKKLEALERSLLAAESLDISTAINIVLPDTSHANRVKHVIDTYGTHAKIRILNSLDGGWESYNAVYSLLDELAARPNLVHLTAGASGMSTDYVLPNGQIIGFKQIRKTHLPDTCRTCVKKDKDCEEGYYGLRMYRGTDKVDRIGVCIQRMDLTLPITDFLKSGIPEEVMKLRIDDYNNLCHNL